MSELDHNGQQKSLMQRFMSELRELFDHVCKELRLTIFFCLYCYLFVALLCLYFFLCKLELFWA